MDLEIEYQSRDSIDMMKPEFWHKIVEEILESRCPRRLSDYSCLLFAVSLQFSDIVAT